MCQSHQLLKTIFLQNMAQQDQIIINMSQVNQDQKQRLLKLFPKNLLLTFSLLQLVSGIAAMLSQVSLKFLQKISMKLHLCFQYSDHWYWS